MLIQFFVLQNAGLVGNMGYMHLARCEQQHILLFSSSVVRFRGITSPHYDVSPLLTENRKLFMISHQHFDVRLRTAYC